MFDPKAGNLATESLVAMTGILPTRGPNELEIRGSDTNYVNRVRRRLSTFLDSTKVEKIKWERPPSQKHLWAELVKQVALDDMDDWFDGWAGDPAVPVEYMAVISQAREYVKKAWPIYPDPSIGLHTFELSEDELGDVWHLFRTLNDPETIFDDLDSLVLLPEQVTAIATVYPALYSQICAMATLLLQPFAGIQDVIKPTKQLLAEREEQIRTLLQVPQDAPVVVQAEKEQQKKQEQPAPSRAQSHAEVTTQIPSEHTVQQRLAR